MDLNINENNINKVMDLLEKVGTKIGEGGEVIWEALIIGQLFNGIERLGFIILTVVASVFYFKKYVNVKDEDFYDCDEPKNIICALILGLCVFIMYIISIENFGGIFNMFFNPEYSAFKELLDIVN